MENPRRFPKWTACRLGWWLLVSRPMKLLALLLVPASCILTLPQDSTNSGDHFVLQRNIPVPMRDGVVLRADVLRPIEDGKFPVLVYRTPYGKEAAQREYTTFQRAAKRGYAVVIEDVRGRFQSDGEF